MALKEQLQQLGSVKDTPFVTISLNTHRTRPDSLQDEILLKNLLNEAKERVVSTFGQKPVTELLKNMAAVQNEIDFSENLDSLHLFFGNHTKEIVRSPWPLQKNIVHVSRTFAIRPLIKAYNRSESYLVMLLSQNGVNLYEAVNDDIIQEIVNNDFPLEDNIHYNIVHDKRSDPDYVDNVIRDFFNRIDKALVKVYNETDLKCVVVCTESNYNLLKQVADKPEVYVGYVSVDYNNTAPHQIVQQTWKLMESLLQQRRTKAITELREAVDHGRVLTDLQEIYRAAIDGRGELLIVHQNFTQPVLMSDERTFELIEDASLPGAIDDISSNIAWEVISKKGRVVFTGQEDIKEFGKIALKTRY